MLSALRVRENSKSSGGPASKCHSIKLHVHLLSTVCEQSGLLRLRHILVKEKVKSKQMERADTECDTIHSTDNTVCSFCRLIFLHLNSFTLSVFSR